MPYKNAKLKSHFLIFIRKFDQLYSFLAQRAYSAIIFGALFCTLAVKLFHSLRTGLVNEYPVWIFSDIAVLGSIEVILSIIYFRWRKRWVVRAATIIAAVVCTWSVMNAGWLIRTGTQILPCVLLPLVRSPVNSLIIIGSNLVEMPKAALALLGPSAIALAFFFSVLARPQLAVYNHKRFTKRIIVCCIFISIAVAGGALADKRGSSQTASEELLYNCQLRAVTSFMLPGQLSKTDLANAKRKIPAFDEIKLPLKQQHINHNVIIVVLEGVQFNYTSLSERGNNLTPYLGMLAGQGVKFTNARSILTHTTKALFGLLTGRFPSASQDIVEAVPVIKPYASIATILKHQSNYRTAFFQSAKGSFECRPGLVHNLGFDKFWAREDLNDPNAFLGSLGCDEFSMLEPIAEWIKTDNKPFLLTIMCSVTHDPYEVPEWFAQPAEEPIERYRQTIAYTDKFIAALGAMLAELNLADKTIFCVAGDHGEGFGEHGLLGHERIAFDETLRIPLVIRCPSLVGSGLNITEPVSSVDLTPTLLGLLGFETKAADFDGVNVLATVPKDRKIYFSGWMQQGPAGFIKANSKFVYYPTSKIVSVYDLMTDPSELASIEIGQQQAQTIADEITNWRRNSVFRLEQKRTGKNVLFKVWLCRWFGRISWAKYNPKIRTAVVY
ncbi:MAG: hypothetical protein DRP62_00725 [Planctomycetota bacterium]|nr:MAG: hypothetical protein DRP62_00725 [Planctomycetota bacterium]